MTIYALSTPKGKGAIAIVRISGEKASNILETLIKAPVPKARFAHFSPLYNPENDDILDEALVLFFPHSQSYTGEDMVELHLHGGQAVIESVLSALETQKGVRLAQAGEFTRLAVLNGRMDLTSAEGVADMINAQSYAQQQQAVRQMRGALGKLYESWRQKLMTALAHLEADIEFADEELPGGIGKEALLDVIQLRDEIKDHSENTRGQVLRDGVEVAITGITNVGKSSLLNALANKDVVIVTEQEGTTRDIIEISINLNGIPVLLSDMAGLRETKEVIEKEGVKRARKKAKEADMRIFVFSPDREINSVELDNMKNMWQEGDICVANKADISSLDSKNIENTPFFKNIYSLSVKTGQGMDEFIHILEEKVQKRFGVSEMPALTRTRHREALEEVLMALKSVPSKGFVHPELIVEDIRVAAHALGRITGKFDVEVLLDIVFRDFCIGK